MTTKQIIDDTTQVVLSSVIEKLENPLTTKASIAKALKEMHRDITNRQAREDRIRELTDEVRKGMQQDDN